MSIEWYCSVVGVDKATFYRWKKNKVDKRKDSSHPRFKQYSQEHENKVLKAIKLNSDLTADELIATFLDKRDDKGQPIGYYIGSRSYVYRLMHKYKLINSKRAGGKGKRHNFNQNKLIATGPNQVYVWDITYIYKNIEGEYFYLYAMMDLYSRKMIHWEVHKTQSAEIAAKFLENALTKENIAIKGHLTGRKSPINADVTIQDKLILHSDNGGPMKGKNMLVKMEALGITASYSRPHHSNDNAHMESSFATLKHSHSMPIPKCFACVKEASKWMDDFYDWYNNKHLHSGINFITPNDCHKGLGTSIMENRNRIIKKSENCCHKLYSMPKQVTLMSFATKRKVVEKSTKKYDYQNCKEAA